MLWFCSQGLEPYQHICTVPCRGWDLAAGARWQQGTGAQPGFDSHFLLSEAICPQGALPVFGSEQPGPWPARFGFFFFWQARSARGWLAELLRCATADGLQAAHRRVH